MTTALREPIAFMENVTTAVLFWHINTAHLLNVAKSSEPFL
jgi:hypothetical protein